MISSRERPAPVCRSTNARTGRDFAVTVPARVLSTDASLNRRLAIAGLGVTLSFESHVREAIERGQLVSILEEFCAPFPGYYLYYPQRRQASRALRALIDHVQRWRRAGRRKRAH
jgi:DNA-binding transcriptional LysR family regulator